MPDSNIIHQIYLDRAEALLADLHHANIVSHGPTIGELREQAIISSLKGIIPHSFEVSSGFVVDALGGITPQIDIVVFKRGTLSPILLSTVTALVPIELFKFGIEVKSTVTRDTFVQIKSQAASLASLCNTAFIAATPPNENHTTVSFKKQSAPFLLVAATSSLSEDTLKAELNAADGLLGVIVFDKCILYKNGGSFSGESDLERVMRFFGYMFQHCIDMSNYVTITAEKENELFDALQQQHPELDFSREATRKTVLECIKTPSLLTYLYPIKQVDVA